ncbi:M14 family zinc carboxypeptidase [Winogradskyella ouciana]|uniref:T9SS type A sorting domain-containing protein n=1 Tax=Winogradskyella ouciana TaxID=2608631 RepID=A0A7K1GHP7_9FLAO|nr:M14 family zinc carboxypeptidase [Winogradskyella ouciana]MTE27539.1 T9SS type A sorting domain-containing protein [Winogradskyella ouciana]
MKKITLWLLACMLLSTAFSQELQKREVDNLLNTQGELTFNFKIETKEQLKSLSKTLTIVNFNSNTKEVKAWANQEQFENFLTMNISYKVFEEDNDINERLMSDDISVFSRAPKPGYTLEFPLTAYPTYADYASQMQNFETEHSDIVDFFSIGTTGQGDKEILFVKISDNISTDEAEPKLLYTSSMHGDEIAGYPMMLNLIDYIITAYKDNTHPDHTRIADLVNGSEIWINPNANPDGTYHLSTDNTSVANARRGNGNNVDLNRNYPDNLGGAHTDGEVYQAETLMFMQLAEDNHFVISANFHGGIELVNYPWDNTYDRHPDDSWFILTAGEYRDNAQNDGPAGYMDDENNGITHGADWYLVNGGRQDYMNHDHQCKEVTIELSNTKKPPANQLDDFWNYNREALLDYLTQGTYGFRGMVKDVNTGNPIEGATIKAVGHDDLGSWTVSDVDGDYYRPIYGGTYDLIFEAPCYQSVTLSSETISNYQTKILADVLMTPLTPTVPGSLNATNIVSSSATLSWSSATGSSYDLRYREVGSGTWEEVLDIDSDSYSLTGLNPETNYEYEVRSNCGTNSSAYSPTENFTTAVVSYCAAQGNNINDEYIGEVSLNGTANNSLGTTSSGYSNYRGSSIFSPIEIGSTGNTISVMKYWETTQYNEAVSVWIDYDQDGIFTNAEKILEAGAYINPQTVSNTFTVPNSAKTGDTVIRVIMKYYNNANEGTNQTDPCETFAYGEVEDYTVNLFDQTLGLENNNIKNIKIYPNPFSNTIDIIVPSNISDDNVLVTIYDVLGRTVYNQSAKSVNQTIKLSSLNHLKGGSYILKIQNLTKNQTLVKQLVKQ